MEVAILGFYPKTQFPQKKYYEGTLHISLPSLGMELRGILCKYNKGKVFIRLPYKKGFNSDKNKEITYSVVSFKDRNKNRKLIDKARLLARGFIESNIIKQKPLLVHSRINNGSILTSANK